MRIEEGLKRFFYLARFLTSSMATPIPAANTNRSDAPFRVLLNCIFLRIVSMLPRFFDIWLLNGFQARKRGGPVPHRVLFDIFL